MVLSLDKDTLDYNVSLSNGAQDKIDYEIIFLGETRDFSSAIGDATMCSLNMPELSHTY